MDDERKIIFVLCILAGIHVFVFSAAFPFFNSVDEPIHFDLAVKYSQGHLPRGLETISPESALYLSLYSSLAYLGTSDRLPGGQFPSPPWMQPVEQVRASLAVNIPAWEGQKNYEAAQPPLYYALAGFWWDIGKEIGFQGERLLYWLRFLNVALMMAMVWIAYVVTRAIFPDNMFPRIGAPALLAFMPQTTFYSIENDVLSPVCFGIALVCLVRFWQAEAPTVRLGMATGLALAATGLTKFTNLPLLAVSGSLILLKIFQLFKSNKLPAAIPSTIALAICAGLPMAGWAIWTKHAFGDFTGAEAKIEHLGWTHKPIGEWFHHPIFTPGGFWFFVSGNLSTFWQGEFLWHAKPLAAPAVDFIYAMLSVIFIGTTLVDLSRGSNISDVPQRQILWFAFAAVAGALAFFGFLSLIYDFHNCFYPSRERPYFISGRLWLGALIPFLLLFIYGMDRLLNHFGKAAKFYALAAMILFMLASETMIDWPVFSNEFNWFHL
ncbi:MAG TPA: DUF2142 domain-containing protein [Verrucomicrobiae bacterium]|nr:DUF2142 domain-containing protein [Verrucomicrobiae bacterium]